ncbi:MAG TPA: hypothetical protein VFT04_10060 [Gemmatimonadales bacterium]|nr:hypothetical protein [Gemmatimonadales bacterium]
MSADRQRAMMVAITLLGLGACRSGPRVEIAWVGADTGAAVLPATARRCGAGPVELTAMSGDTGVAFVIHGNAPLEAGRYPLTGPNEAASSPPAAAFAARWTDSMDLFAWRTAEGALELTATEELRGSFSGRAERWGGGTGEVEISGEIVGVPVGPCPAG